MSSAGWSSGRVWGEEGMLVGGGSADEGKGGRKAGTWEGGFQFAVLGRLRGEGGLDMGEGGSRDDGERNVLSDSSTSPSLSDCNSESYRRYSSNIVLPRSWLKPAASWAADRQFKGVCGMTKLQTLEFIQILGPPCGVLGIAVELLCFNSAVFLELVEPDAHLVEGSEGVTGSEGRPAGLVGVFCTCF